MSGFVAIINTNGAPVDCEILKWLTDALHFRGTDRQKVWSEGHVGFGHALYGTTFESHYEFQPSSLDGEFWITGTARIDARSDLLNKLGLQSELRLDQIPDSDLILYAYRAWGERCLDYLLGDFSFVIWDKGRKKVFCARDQFGMRQLYYSQIRESLIISNSLYCIQQHPAVSKTLDEGAMAGFLLFGDHTWLDKELTVYADVKSLLPAHSLVLNSDGFMVRKKYWDIPANIPLLRYRNENDYREHFREVFKKAVCDRIRTDRVVLAMSGGMDSSTIAAMLCEIQNEDNHPFHISPVTVVYNTVHPCREHYFAGLVARRLGLSIHYIDGDLYPFLGEAINTTRPLEIDQPSLWMDIMRQESLLGRVVLTGAAADNLLSYPASLASLRAAGNPFKIVSDSIQLRKRYGQFPGLGTGLLNKFRNIWPINGSGGSAPYPYPSWIKSDFEEKMCLKDVWAERWASSGRLFELRSRASLLHESLLTMDWCSDDSVMKNEFPPPEKRDPYLDIRMVEFVLSLPAIPWLFNKHVLRCSMKGKLPGEVIERPKTPLGMLQQSLLELPGTQWVDEWKAVPGLKPYIERSKIPRLAGGVQGAVSSYINLRPLMLNRWLGCLSI